MARVWRVAESVDELVLPLVHLLDCRLEKAKVILKEGGRFPSMMGS